MSPPQLYEVDVPAGFVPQVALAFGTDGVAATPVDRTSPLPVFTTLAASQSAPLQGTTGVSGSLGPFAPELARPIYLRLSGTWVGTVTVLRSTDNGATRFALTLGGSAWGVFTANVNETVAEEGVAGATYYLDVQLTSGTIAYRMEQ